MAQNHRPLHSFSCKIHREVKLFIFFSYIVRVERWTLTKSTVQAICNEVKYFSVSNWRTYWKKISKSNGEKDRVRVWLYYIGVRLPNLKGFSKETRGILYFLQTIAQPRSKFHKGKTLFLTRKRLECQPFGFASFSFERRALKDPATVIPQQSR